MKRTTLKLGAFLTSLFALLVLFPAAAYAAPTTIEINPANFPDANFRSWVDTNYGNAGYLDDSALTATFIDVSVQNIATLQGIEYFPLLEELRCYNNKLTALNVSNNPHLVTLIGAYNQITTIDVSSNLLLEHLDIGSNLITSLDVNDLQSLLALACDTNQIASLDVTNNPLLQELWCFDNQLSSLDVSGNPSLYSLWCDGNQFLDIIGLPTSLSYYFSAINQASTILVVPDPANPGSYVSTRQYPLYAGHTIALDPAASYGAGNTFSTTLLDTPLGFTTSTQAGDITGTVTFKLASQHTVTHLDWDGTVLDTQQVYEGLAPVTPPNPSRSGYVFTGWGQPVTDPTTGIVTITALYDPIATTPQTPSTVLPATGDTSTPLLALGASSLIAAAALALLACRRRAA